MSERIKCAVSGCQKEGQTKKMCWMHYSRVRRFGSIDLPEGMVPRQPKLMLPWECAACGKAWLATRDERKTEYCSYACQTSGFVGKQELTAEKLRKMMRYDPETGVFTRLIRTSNSVQVGDTFGAINKQDGYIGGTVFGVGHRAHRLAWLYMTGAWPKEYIDHINGDRADNRWANLRDIPGAVNLQNRQCATAASKTGVLGVWRRKGKYVSQVTVGKKRITVGTFETIEQASAAYLEARRKHLPGNTL